MMKRKPNPTECKKIKDAIMDYGELSPQARDVFDKVRASKSIFDAVDAKDTTKEDRRALTALGVNFTVDRMGKPFATWPQQKRADALKEKVLAKRAKPGEKAGEEVPSNPQSYEFTMYIHENVSEETQGAARDFANKDAQIKRWEKEIAAHGKEKGWGYMSGAGDEYTNTRSKKIGDRHLILFNEYIYNQIKTTKPTPAKPGEKAGWEEGVRGKGQGAFADEIKYRCEKMGVTKKRIADALDAPRPLDQCCLVAQIHAWFFGCDLTLAECVDLGV